jgi:hypothetical protein
MRHSIFQSTFASASVIVALIVGAAGYPSIAVGATADFRVVAQSVSVDRDAGTATFTLDFDREPRFFLPHGGGGDQPDGFQIEIDADYNMFDRPIAFDDIDAVVRGAEIFAGDGIPVRDRDGDGGGDRAGGWGPVRALVPFDLDGSSLSFTTGLQTLGDDDGQFRYRLIATDGGALTSEINAATIIPLPAAAWSGMALLGVAGVATRLKMRLS